jgi:hypothetical protein
MILGALLLGLAASALSAFLYGYILMLGVLVVHNCWLPGVPRAMQVGNMHRSAAIHRRVESGRRGRATY